MSLDTTHASEPHDRKQPNRSIKPSLPPPATVTVAAEAITTLMAPAILHSMTDAVAVVDPQRRIIAINPAFSAMWGYTIDDLRHQSTEVLFAWEKDFKKLAQGDYCARHQSRSRVSLIRYRRKDGSTFIGETRSSKIEDFHGNTIGYVSITRDTTARREAEAALRTSETKFRLAFENAAAPMLWTDRRGGLVTNCNQAAERLFGRGREEIIGRPHASFHPAEKTIDLHRLVDHPPGQPAIESEVLGNNGRRIPVRIVASVVALRREKILQTIYHDGDAGKQTAAELESAVDTLARQIELRTAELEETDTALRVLLKRVEHEKEELREQLLRQVNELFEPELQKLLRATHSPAQKQSVQLLLTNLQELFSPVNRSIASAMHQFSPMEVRIAHLITQELSTKEIAERLNLSPWTVNVHRRNIRKKCGITNKKVNLRTALASLIG